MSIKLHDILIVGSGGFAGAVARYELSNLFKIAAGGFPLGTFIINLSGSLVLGFFLTLMGQKFPINDRWRLFLATGFVGAYTTFSSFANEILTLYRQNYITMGLLYSWASLAGGMLCVWFGTLLAQRIRIKS